MEMLCHCFLTDSIVSNLISNRKLTVNDECTFLLLLIYFSTPGVSSARCVHMLAIIAMALTKVQSMNEMWMCVCECVWFVCMCRSSSECVV